MTLQNLTTKIVEQENQTKKTEMNTSPKIGRLINEYKGSFIVTDYHKTYYVKKVAIATKLNLIYEQIDSASILDINELANGSYEVLYLVAVTPESIFAKYSEAYTYVADNYEQMRRAIVHSLSFA